MAGLFEGTAPPNVETTRTTAQQAPGYLTEYLSNLAQAGTSALGTTTPAVKDAEGNITTPASFAPFGKDQLIAPMSALQQSAYTNAPNLLGQYSTALNQALTAGKSAMDVGATDISKFYDPYQQQVIDEMQKQSDINVQRNVLPALKALGVMGGAGGFGSSRTGAIGGQALADIAANLQAQQTAARSKGFQTALDAALKEQGQQTGAASALSNLGNIEAQAGLGEAKGLAELGAQQTAYDQLKLEAPLTRAANVAQLLRGYQYPTTTTETYKGPASAYGPSALSQIAGLGTLVGAAFPVDKAGNIGGLGALLGKVFSGTGSSSGGYGEGLTDNETITMPGSTWTPPND